MKTSWVTQALALFRKDLIAEFRTRTAMSAIGVFSLASLMLIALATATLKELTFLDNVSEAMKPAWQPPSKFGILWVLLFFAGFSGLAHSFVHEEETGTVMALRLRMIPEAIYVGKLLLNFLLVFGVACGVSPLYMLITGMPLGNPFVFTLVMLGGCLGLSAAATIVAAIAAKARNKGALFGALGLPLIVVFLMLLMGAANTLFTVAPSLERIVRDVGGLLSYAVLLIAVSALTFRYIWEE